VDVFLVPVAPDRYELYCEEPDEPVPDEDAPKGRFRRMIHRSRRQLVHRFREMVAEAERDQRRGGPEPPAVPRSLLGRMKARTLRWVAESVAEQRLLWQLRGKGEARLVHPDDLTEAHAQQLLRRSLQRDWERHRFWLIIDSLGGIASTLLILLPGPNLIGYYFLFRMVGHYFSLRGARHGMTGVMWITDASGPLTILRTIVGTPPDSREEIVRQVELTLRLERLASFFQRTSIP
jgi:hypothetical protein